MVIQPLRNAIAMRMIPEQLAERIRAQGKTLDAPATMQLYAPLLAMQNRVRVQVVCDQVYERMAFT